jgi:amidohydrolase
MNKEEPIRSCGFSSHGSAAAAGAAQTSRVREIYSILHGMPEIAFQEEKTATFLAGQLAAAGYAVTTGVAGTGVVGVLRGAQPGPVLALRADMDALKHVVDGKECAIHSCGHDAHMAMVLCAAEEIAARKLATGTLKIFFQPAEEILRGAIGFVEAGVVDDVDAILGIHLRPEQEARKGQATPALCHGSSSRIAVTLEGLASHSARPHLGVNAINAAAAVINAVNALHMNPIVPHSIKVTQLHAGGPAANIIPDRAEMTIDVRAQKNQAMDELLKKAEAAIKGAAASVGARPEITIRRGAPAAEYSAEMVALAREAIIAVLGHDGLVPEIITPGADDFHFYAQRKPALKAAYVGLGCDLSPGLHHPQMRFDLTALHDGVQILQHAVRNFLGLAHQPNHVE